MKKVVLIASDHAGFLTKEKLKVFLLKKGYTLVDFSPKLIQGDDYPDYAFALGKEVASSGNPGILVCGTGAGMIIAANKVKGIRAVDVYDIFTARLSREHNDANIISLSGWHIPFDRIKQITKVFLETKFSGDKRHVRRLKKIEKYELRK